MTTLIAQFRVCVNIIILFYRFGSMYNLNITMNISIISYSNMALNYISEHTSPKACTTHIIYCTDVIIAALAMVSLNNEK